MRKDEKQRERVDINKLETSGVSQGVEDGCRLPSLWLGHPRNSHKAASGVAFLQGIEGWGMAGPDETLGSPWPVGHPMPYAHVSECTLV
jgi:hypothetical protein